MPVDIRNFFGKKGSAASSSKTKSNEKDKKSSKKVKATSSSRSSGSKKTTPLSPIQEDVPVAAAAVSSKKSKRKFVLDSDSEEEEQKVPSGSETEGEEEPKKQAPTARRGNEKPQNKNLKEVDASDFFAKSTSKRSSLRNYKPKKSYAVDLESEEEEEEEEEEYQMENDPDEALEVDDEEEKPKPSKKRASPKVAKSPPTKPIRKPSPYKKPKLEEDDVVNLAEDSDEAPAAAETPPSRAAKTKRSGSKSAVDDDEGTPPSTKKLKTETKKRGTASAKKEKEPLIEPSLELDSFDTDSAVPECMAGITVVFTGIPAGTTMSRDDASDYVKILGARVTTAVSTKTDYLVVLGEELENGKEYTAGSKYIKATQLGTVKIVMGIKQLYGLAKLYSDKAEARKPKDKENNQKEEPTMAAAPAKPAATSTNPYAKANNPYAKNSVTNPYAKNSVTNPYAKNSVTNPYAKANNPYAKANNPYAKANKPASSQPEELPATTRKFGPNDLWVDKHAPDSTRSILGNQENVKKLVSWLASWERKFNNDKAVGKAYSNPQGPWKAALLSGPPGIGKTTTATLVAKEAGRDVLEFNASDVRSKKVMSECFGDITGSQCVEGYFQKVGAPKTSKPGKKKLRALIFDEVDGMSAGDRGGMAELIQMIKNSRVPIICICNDRQSQKIKSLLPYCFDLRFRRPVKTQIAKAAMRIAELEGMTVEANAAEAIAESCGNDIRQVINALQMWASEKQSSTMTYKDLKERENAINKDEILRVSLFDAAKTIMEGRKGLQGADMKEQAVSFYRRNEAFFVDYSLTGLLVQQNYLRVMSPRYTEIKRTNDDDKAQEFLEEMHLAAQSMSDYTMVEHKIRGGSDMNWGLLPFAGTLAVKTGFHTSGPNGAFFAGFPEFTSWLGRNSSKGKKQRILQELNHHMNYKISGGTQEVRMSYLPFLRQRFSSLLKESQEEPEQNRFDVAIELMDEYGLDREDVFENMDEFKMAKGDNLADALDSKSKAAFTRAYNAGSHKSQALVDEQGAPSKSKRKASASADPEDPDAIDDDVVEDDNDENDDEDLEKLRSAFAKKGRKAASTKAKAAPKGKGRGKKK